MALKLHFFFHAMALRPGRFEHLSHLVGAMRQSGVQVSNALTSLRARLQKDSRGAVMTEYVVIVGTVSVVIAGALAAVGPLLLASYERSRSILVSPFP